MPYVEISYGGWDWVEEPETPFPEGAHERFFENFGTKNPDRRKRAKAINMANQNASQGGLHKVTPNMKSRIFR
jgi:hypothetical protein